MQTQADFDIKDYRQPLVTSLGVILGFFVGFLGQWVTENDFALHTASDWIAFCASLTAVLMLLTALFRMLTPVRKGNKAYAFYRNTLHLYMAGVLCAFGGLVVSAFV